MMVNDGWHVVNDGFMGYWMAFRFVLPGDPQSSSPWSEGIQKWPENVGFHSSIPDIASLNLMNWIPRNGHVQLFNLMNHLGYPQNEELKRLNPQKWPSVPFAASILDTYRWSAVYLKYRFNAKHISARMLSDQPKHVELSENSVSSKYPGQSSFPYQKLPFVWGILLC